MILHPLLLTVVLSDLVGLLFLLFAIWQTHGVLAGWRPHTNTARQLTLERQVEMAGWHASLSLGSFALGGLLLLVAVCHLLPALVPGAMCGTGVLQAAGPVGWRSLGFRCLALVVLGAVRLMVDLNQRTPTAPLARPLAKALLLALPLCGWTLWDTARAFLALDTHSPVSCCAVVYSQVEASAATTVSATLSLPGPFMVAVLALVSSLMLVLLCTDSAPGNPKGERAALLLPITATLWLPIAGTVLLTRFAAYHFEVLAHHCPWCLLLPEHGMVGYPLLGAFALMAMEAPLPWLARRLVQRHPDCAPAAVQRIARVRRRILLAMAVYWLVGGLPAIIWRLRYGVWIG